MRIESPKRVKSRLFWVLEFVQGRGRRGGWKLQLDDSSFQADHCRLRSVVGAQFGEDVLDSPLNGFLGDGELIRNLLAQPACATQYPGSHRSITIFDQRCYEEFANLRVLGQLAAIPTYKAGKRANPKSAVARD